MTLRDLCHMKGLTPIVTVVRVVRMRGRPKGSMDQYDRMAARRQRIEAHAEAMRERFGTVEELEREQRGELR